MRLLSDGVLTVNGILLFAKNPQIWLPVFNAKAVCYPGHDIHATTYLDRADIVGRLQVQFEESLSFILRNLRREQHGQGINTTGEREFQELCWNNWLLTP
jgi:ATP-dependent DNA helicase RecG